MNWFKKEQKPNAEKEKVFRGAIVIFHKKIDGQTHYLVVENAETHNITFISGGEEEIDDNNLEQTAKREIKEELNLNSDQYVLKPTDIKQEFVYGAKKVERAGYKGSNQVFMAELLDIETINHTNDLGETKWMTAEQVLSSLTFDDLKEVFRKIIKVIE